MSTACLFPLLVAVALPAQAAERPDYTGLWLPDAAASSVEKVLKSAASSAEAPPPPPPQQALPPIRIEHRDPTLTVTSLDAQGDVVGSYALTTDGVAAVNPRGAGLVHRSETVWRGTALVTRWQLEKDGNTVIQGTEVRALSEDGRRLTVTGDVEDAKSKSRRVTVYARGTPAPVATGDSSAAGAALELRRLFDTSGHWPRGAAASSCGGHPSASPDPARTPAPRTCPE